MARILLIDDDRDILRLLKIAFESAGHEVVTVEGSDGIEETIVHSDIDVVVLDIMMPGRTGWEVLADLRANLSTAHLPVLLLSAIGDPHNRVRGIRLGADDFVSKPFYADEVIARAEGLVERYAQAGAFQGALTAIAAGEVAQTVAHAEQSGRLVLSRRGQAGCLEFDRGRLVAAELGTLVGSEAALELISWTDGRFRFLPERQGETAQAACSSAMLRIDKLQLDATWLRDELGRRESFIPALDAHLFWALREAPAELPGLPALPLALVQQRLQAVAGATLESLVVSCGVATARFLLAIAVLIQEGYIEVENRDDVEATRPGTAAQVGLRLEG